MSIVNERMEGLGNVRSAIRDLFEYGLKRSEEIGRENIFDYSLGNPSVPSPPCVNEAIVDIVTTEDPTTLHGYTSAAGDADVKKAIADDICNRFGYPARPSDIYMTCGAAASLTITLSALIRPGDEVVAVAPFFPEYRVFSEQAGAVFRVVTADTENFQINFSSLRETVNPHTKAIIINSPNNPTGVIFSRETITKLCDFLREKEKEYGHPIFMIADEPYRELVYDNKEVPYLPACYDNTIVGYSFSKSLSLPGERIGYIFVPEKVIEHDAVFAAVAGAGRSLGYVCAPGLFQRVSARCLGQTADLSIYKKNRDLLYENLTRYGYNCVYPDGAFYLFVKSPEKDAKAFCECAKKYELLLVPSDSFGCEGYVRIAYCVQTSMVERSLPAFEKLISEYK